MINLRENEKILRIVRRNLTVLSGSFLLPVAAIALFAVVRIYFPQFTFFGYPWQVLLVVLGLGFVLVLSRLYIWRGNALIFTDQRVVQHVQSGLLKSKFRELLYRDIVQVEFRRKGLSSLTRGSGTVILGTGGKERIMLDRVADPESVVELVNSIRQSVPVSSPEQTEPKRDVKNPEL